MNPVVSHIWPQACGERAIEPGAKYCDGKQCFVSVSWLAQQVFYMPCLAAGGDGGIRAARRR